MLSSGLSRSVCLLIIALLAFAASFPGSITMAIGEISWTAIPSMPTDRIEVGLAQGKNGKLYAVGGEALAVQMATVEEYDPVAHTWATRSSMHTPRSSAAVVAADNGKIYAIGGWNSSGWVSAVEEYDPNTDSWTYKSSMRTPRAWFNAARATNGKIYAVGGQSTGYTVVSSMEEYDPATDTWTTKASMPAPRYWMGVVAPSNGKVYIVGGTDAHGTPLSSVLEYDLATDIWTTKASLSAARWNLRAVAGKNGKVYAVGGHDGNYPVSTVEEFDPATNQWTLRGNLPTPIGGMGATVASNGKIYVMGGTTAYEGATVADITPPQIVATVSPAPNAEGWNNSQVTVSWDVSDPDSGISSSTGCGSATLTEETPGTIVGCSATNGAGLSSSSSVTTRIDRTAPIITGAATADPNAAGWYKSDVNIHWTCSDTLSGLASLCPSDSTISGEGSSLSASSPSISDKAGNTSTGVVSGINIDRKAPNVEISLPADGAIYLLNQEVAASYSCSDTLSGLATCAGPVSSGTNIDTGSVGTKTFTVSATDAAGNLASKSQLYSVAYGVDALYDPSRAVKAGSTIPIKLRILDASHSNLSSADLIVKAVSVTLVSTDALGILEDAGNANPDYDFRYDPNPDGGSYIYNLSTKGFSTGTYLTSVHN